MKNTLDGLALYLNIADRIPNNKKTAIDFVYDESEKVGYRNFYNNLADDNIPLLWRYSDLKGFLSFITSNELYFRSIDKFEDDREGENLYFTKIKEELAQKGNSDNDHLEFMEARQKLMQQTCYVNCWRYDDKESPMMWGLYAKNTEGVALKINYEDFLTFINSMYFKLPTLQFHKKLKIPIVNSNKDITLKDTRCAKSVQSFKRKKTDCSFQSPD